MGDGTGRPPREPDLHVLQNEYEQCGGGASAPALRDHFKTAAKLPQSIRREAPEISRVFVEWVTKRYNHMNEAPGRQYSLDFSHDELRPFRVLEHGIAFDALKHVSRKRQLLSVCYDVYARQGKQVDIDVAAYGRSRAADVEIPPAKRRIDFEFARVSNQRLGRTERPCEASFPS